MFRTVLKYILWIYNTFENEIRDKTKTQSVSEEKLLVEF